MTIFPGGYHKIFCNYVHVTVGFPHLPFHSEKAATHEKGGLSLCLSPPLVCFVNCIRVPSKANSSHAFVCIWQSVLISYKVVRIRKKFNVSLCLLFLDHPSNIWTSLYPSSRSLSRSPSLSILLSLSLSPSLSLSLSPLLQPPNR